MDSFYDTLYAKAGEMFAILAPIAFVLIVLSLWTSISGSGKSATAYLKAIARCAALILVLSQLITWTGLIEDGVESLVYGTLNADPSAVYERYKTMTADQSSGDSKGFWYTMFHLSEKELFKAVIAAVLWTAQFIAKITVSNNGCPGVTHSSRVSFSVGFRSKQMRSLHRRVFLIETNADGTRRLRESSYLLDLIVPDKPPRLLPTLLSENTTRGRVAHLQRNARGVLNVAQAIARVAVPQGVGLPLELDRFLALFDAGLAETLPRLREHVVARIADHVTRGFAKRQ